MGQSVPSIKAKMFYQMSVATYVHMYVCILLRNFQCVLIHCTSDKAIKIQSNHQNFGLFHKIIMYLLIIFSLTLLAFPIWKGFSMIFNPNLIIHWFRESQEPWISISPTPGSWILEVYLILWFQQSLT